jgi:hypothetical protein
MILPLLFMLWTYVFGDHDYEGWTSAALQFYFACFVPISTGLMGFSILPQKRIIKKQGVPEGLSPNTLLLQAILFPLLGISWIWRLPISGETWELPLPKALLKWYFTAGWSTVDALIFGSVQGYLYWVYKKAHKLSEAGERRPLLGDRIDEEAS